MSESEAFWISVLDGLDNHELPASLDPSGIASDTPDWVTKVAAETMTMVMPRVQLRMGDKATPEKVGALVGNHLALSEGVMELASNLGCHAVLQWAKPILGGFDGVAAIDEMARHKSYRRDSLVNVLRKVLERPREERYRFFRAFTRGIQPEKKSGEVTKRDKRQMNTLAVYGVVLTNWREFDVLATSREAYDRLVKLLSFEIVGYDPERIRRMFDRLGKRFARPGKPAKR